MEAATKASAAAAEAKAAGFTAENASEQVSEESSQEATEANLDPVSENKDVRKLEKKLRDISKLEVKLAAGERVDPLQVKKIEKKDALEAELNALKERLMKEVSESKTQMGMKISPPPGFDNQPSGKCSFSPINRLKCGSLSPSGGSVDAFEDDATTLPGSTASDQGGDSDSESQMSEFRSSWRLSASAPVFVPQHQAAFCPLLPMSVVPMDYDLRAMEHVMSAARTPLKNTAALFTPNNRTEGGKLRQDAAPFIPGGLRQDAPSFIPEAEESFVPEAKEEEEKVTWRSTRSRKEEEEEEQPDSQPRTKLTTGSAELFVPQFPDLKASVEMKTKGNSKAKKVTRI